MCRKDDKEETEPQKVAEALAPELFMLALSEAHVHMERTPVRRRNGAILRCHAKDPNGNGHQCLQQRLILRVRCRRSARGYPRLPGAGGYFDPPV
jgi:hypothetical protein